MDAVYKTHPRSPKSAPTSPRIPSDPIQTNLVNHFSAPSSPGNNIYDPMFWSVETGLSLSPPPASSTPLHIYRSPSAPPAGANTDQTQTLINFTPPPPFTTLGLAPYNTQDPELKQLQEHLHQTPKPRNCNIIALPDC